MLPNQPTERVRITVVSNKSIKRRLEVVVIDATFWRDSLGYGWAVTGRQSDLVSHDQSSVAPSRWTNGLIGLLRG